MKKSTVKHALAIFAVAVLLVCMLVPAYAAFPMARDAERNVQRSATTTTVVTNDENPLPMPEGNITEGETQDGIIGDDDATVTTTTRATTTTRSPATTTAPTTTSMLEDVTDGAESGRGFVIWGIVLALIIAAAVVAVIMMTGRSRRR